MNQKTFQLAQKELARYQIAADLVIQEDLPSFELRRKGGKTVIAAPDAGELLYGVYDFAERFGGWSFFEPGKDAFDASRVQSLPDDGVLIPARKPLLKRRGFIQEFPFDEDTPQLFDWMAKNKLNYLLVWMKYYDELSAELKEAAQMRGIVIESGHHNFNYWIPGRKYNETHPEFFAEIGGKRIQSSDGKSALLLSEQLCTTNPDLRAEIAANMLRYSEEHPEVKIIALVPNDGFGWCECEKCSQFYDKNKKGDFYSLSEHVYKADRIYHDLLQDVAARLQKARPDLQLTFFAYVNYCSPAPGFHLTSNLAVHFAPYWRCINHTIDDPACPVNSHYAQDILNWCKAKDGGEVNIYEYYMGVNFYLSLPMIHFFEMFHEMQFYAEHGVDGILTQFFLSHWRVYGMNYALMGRAARGEDARTAVDALFSERFGADAEEGKAFYRRLKSLMADMKGCHVPYPYSLLSRTKQEQYTAILEAAKRLCAKKPSDCARAELVIWAEYLLRFKNLFDAAHADTLMENDLDAFLSWIHSHKETRIFVQPKFDLYFKALRDDLRQGKPWLHFNLDWEDDYIRRQEKTIY